MSLEGRRGRGTIQEGAVKCRLEKDRDKPLRGFPTLSFTLCVCACVCLSQQEIRTDGQMAQREDRWGAWYRSIFDKMML